MCIQSFFVTSQLIFGDFEHIVLEKTQPKMCVERVYNYLNLCCMVFKKYCNWMKWRCPIIDQHRRFMSLLIWRPSQMIYELCKITIWAHKSQNPTKNNPQILTKRQTNKSPENQKPIDEHAHSMQNFDHWETIDKYPNRQLFSQTSFIMLNCFKHWFISSISIYLSCLHNF